MYSNLDLLFSDLSKSTFRSRFHLRREEKEYVYKHGYENVREQARTLLEKRVGEDYPEKDGKQTPMKGHPIFIAQHATGTCCRECIEKWHGISKGHRLTSVEIEYLTDVIMKYIDKEMLKFEYIDDTPTLF